MATDPPSVPAGQFKARCLELMDQVQARRTPIVIDSTALPGELHGDPADRLIVATARQHDAVLVTRDAKLLGYGFVSTVAA